MADHGVCVRVWVFTVAAVVVVYARFGSSAARKVERESRVALAAG